MKLRFRGVANARLHSEGLRTDEVVLLLVYLGSHASRVRVEDVPPEMDVVWLVAAIILDMEKEAVVLQAIRITHRNRQGQSLEMLVQVARDDIEKMVEAIKVSDIILKVRVEGRITWCYKWNLKCHIRADYPTL